MRIMWWENLSVLEAVSRCGTMTEAARELGVDKATVSRRMLELSRAAPAPLYEPRLKGFALTPYGMRALSAYRAHRESCRKLMAELDANPQDARGTVQLTAPTFFACEVIVPGIAAFSRAHPHIAIAIHASNRILDLVKGEADVAVRSCKPTAPSLASRRVARLGLALYGSRSYLARRGGLRQPHDLQGHDLISYDTGPYVGPGFEWLAEAARRAHIAFSANDAYALRDATRAGLGLAVLPHCLGDEAEDLCRVPGGGEGAASVYVVTRASERAVPRLRAVVQFLVERIRAQEPRLYAP